MPCVLYPLGEGSAWPGQLWWSLAVPQMDRQAHDVFASLQQWVTGRPLPPSCPLTNNRQRKNKHTTPQCQQVTVPQLSLLEAAMARMGRVAVWSMGMGGGKGLNVDVFTEASLAWQKRYSELTRQRALAMAAQQRNQQQQPPAAGFGSPEGGREPPWSAWFNNVVSFEVIGRMYLWACR
jgi:hypothetical protein